MLVIGYFGQTIWQFFAQQICKLWLLETLIFLEGKHFLGSFLNIQILVNGDPQMTILGQTFFVAYFGIFSPHNMQLGGQTNFFPVFCPVFGHKNMLIWVIGVRWKSSTPSDILDTLADRRQPSGSHTIKYNQSWKKKNKKKKK